MIIEEKTICIEDIPQNLKSFFEERSNGLNSYIRYTVGDISNYYYYDENEDEKLILHELDKILIECGLELEDIVLVLM